MRCFCVHLAMLSWDFFLPLYPCQFAYEQGVWDTKILNTKTSGPLIVGVTGWSLVTVELMITPRLQEAANVEPICTTVVDKVELGLPTSELGAVSV